MYNTLFTPTGFRIKKDKISTIARVSMLSLLLSVNAHAGESIPEEKMFYNSGTVSGNKVYSTLSIPVNVNVSFLDTVTLLSPEQNALLLFGDVVFHQNVAGGYDGPGTAGTGVGFTTGPQTNSFTFKDKVTFTGSLFDSGNTTGVFNKEAKMDKMHIGHDSNITFNDKITAVGIDINGNATLNFNGQIESDLKISGVNNEVNFGNNASGNGHKIIVIDQNRSSMSFSGPIDFKSLLLDSSDIKFADGSILNTPITEIYNSTLVFEGAATINQDITHTSGVSITFPDDAEKEVIINTNKIITEGIIFHKSKISFLQDVQLSGELQLNNSSFDLNTSSVKIGYEEGIGGFYHNPIEGASFEIHTEYDVNKTIGHFVLGNNAGIALADYTDGGSEVSKLGQMNIVLLDSSGEVPAEGDVIEKELFAHYEEAKVFKLLDKEQINLTVNGGSQYSEWTYTDNGILQLRRKANATDILQDNVQGQNSVVVDNIQNIIDQSPDTTTDLLNADNPEDVVNRLANPDALVIASTPVTRITENATQSISNRANKFVAVPLGVSSGDATLRHGAWFTPFIGSSTQKSRNLSPGYKSNYSGAVIGVDTLINDSTTIGAAMTFAQAKIKHRNINQGDRTKFNSYIGSLYATHEINDSWFIQAMSSFGYNKIKNSELRYETSGINTAHAKYNSKTFGTEVLTGYNYIIKDLLLLTPTIGFDYNYMGSVSYKETGAVNQNLSVKRKALNKVEAIVGARLSDTYTTSNDWSITPDIHSTIRYDLLNKGIKSSIIQLKDNVILVPRPQKNVRTLVNLGMGVHIKNATKSLFEYAIEYDARLANKYTAHQGSLKLRVNL